MQQLFRRLLLCSAAISLFVLLVLFGYAQDAPSMGDVARQARQQKQNKDGQSKAATAAKTPKVITNEEIPEHSEAADGAATSDGESHAGASLSSAPEGEKRSAEQWKSQIRTQKDLVSSMQSGIEKLNDSIQFTPANCVAGCVQWNEHQKQKQQEVERARTQLESQKKRLESMQESARKQGYGSSVYDP
jgi:hypothetical protein